MDASPTREPFEGSQDSEFEAKLMLLSSLMTWRRGRERRQDRRYELSQLRESPRLRHKEDVAPCIPIAEITRMLL